MVYKLQHKLIFLSTKLNKNAAYKNLSMKIKYGLAKNWLLNTCNTIRKNGSIKSINTKWKLF